MKHKRTTLRYILSGILIISTIAVVYSAMCDMGITRPVSITAQHRDVMIDDEQFTLEVADTKEKRQKGLMHRTEMCARCGMIFTFEKPGNYPFWMKDTPLSLDILWIYNGEVVHIASHTTPNSEKLIDPQTEADHVIELRAGTAERMDITIGSQVSIVN